jgi:hypothetical protein
MSQTARAASALIAAAAPTSVVGGISDVPGVEGNVVHDP